jgi:alpha-tubulin suppressor-like RCC1 family protein
MMLSSDSSPSPCTLTILMYPFCLYHRSCGGSTGGLLLSFGKADHGKLGHGDSQVPRAIPTVIEAMRDCDVVKIASMSTYSVVIDAEGGVFVWGTGSTHLMI